MSDKQIQLVAMVVGDQIRGTMTVSGVGVKELRALVDSKVTQELEERRLGA